jgi:putative oxidoreductase
MKIVNLILTYLVAVVFLVLGVGNYFFEFMKQPPPPTADAGTFGMLLFTTKYMLVVKIFELIAGLMLALNFRRALGWAILLPIVINIFLFEVLLAHQPGIGLALLIINLYMILYVHKEKFRPLFQS